MMVLKMIPKVNKTVLSIILIVALTFISFSSSLNNGFVNWDDPDNVTENYLIRDLSLSNIKGIFTYISDYYRPLVFISYALEYSFFGLNATAYHTTNLLLHILNTLLVFWLVLLLSNKTFIALISALLFGVHPLHVESVAWVTERKDILSTFFFLPAIIYYLLYKRRGKWVYYYLSLIAFIFALLSKPVVTLPLVLLLCDYLFHGKFNRRDLLEKFPFFILSVICGIATIITQAPGGAERHPGLANSLNNILIACWGIIFYLYKTIAPFSLSALYPSPKTISILSPEYFLPPILLLFLGIAIFCSRRWTREIIFGTIFFLVTIFPFLQVIHVGNAVAADRYMYIPSIGLFYIVGLAFYKVYTGEAPFEKARKVSIVLFLSVVISTFSVLTYQRNKVWQDSETLWLDVIKNYPEAPLPHVSLGNAYEDRELYKEAAIEYLKALKLTSHPTVALYAYYDLGNVYAKTSNSEDAIRMYKQVISMDPDFPDVHYNLGLVYEGRGLYGDAIKEYRRALSLKPDYPVPLYKLATILDMIGDKKRAVEHYKRFIEIVPSYFDRTYIERAKERILQREK